MSVESRRAAVERLPVYEKGAVVVDANPRRYIIAASCVLAFVIITPYGFLGFPRISLSAALPLLAGIPASWVLRRLYQWLPATQAITVLVDPDGWVRVVMGRGAVRPLGRVLRSGNQRVLLGVILGIFMFLVAIAAMTTIAVVFDQPWLGLTLMGAIYWTLIELVWRIWWIQRRVAAGWRVGMDPLGGWVAIWVRETKGRSWRRGVAADALAEIARYDPHHPQRSKAKKVAERLTRRALTIHWPAEE